MKIIHICDGWEKWNGAANIARLIGAEQSAAGHSVSYERFAAKEDLRSADEVWVHCGWKPCLWRAVRIATGVKGARRPLVRWMPEACYDPVRLKYSRWKKSVAGLLFERRYLRRCDALVATCDEEARWIRKYLGYDEGKSGPKIEIQDISRFFDLGTKIVRPKPERGRDPLKVLYLGRPHPLKGVRYLERAVREINEWSRKNIPGFAERDAIELRVESNVFGDAKEKVWEWSDILCLPTLSDNLGLVVAEAIAHGRRVITTDGAPAWAEFFASHPDNGVYIKGFRSATDDERVRLLADALRSVERGVWG